MKFIIDEMIIGLVKWLRILGFDTVAIPFIKGEKIKDITSRYFITGSKKHFEEWQDQKKVFIPFTSVSKQLNYLNKELNIFEKIKFLSRCLLCNTKLFSVNKSEITDDIPSKVMEKFDRYYQCPNCNKIYWEGGHVQRKLDKLQRMGIKINLNNNQGDNYGESR